nr:AAA family ATPase [Micrococcus luteus]
MRVRQLEIENFRGITKGRVVFQQHTLLVGGNNIGKSTVCEALELVLGPERLYRRPVIDEHDFSHGAYLGDEGGPRGACQMVCVSRTERNGKNHDHDRREEPRRALGPGPGRAAESLRAA